MSNRAITLSLADNRKRLDPSAGAQSPAVRHPTAPAPGTARSYGSKWMSDAPCLIASNNTLLTNFTTGASSASFVSPSLPTLPRRQGQECNLQPEAKSAISTVKHLILLGNDLADRFQQLLLLNND